MKAFLNINIATFFKNSNIWCIVTKKILLIKYESGDGATKKKTGKSAVANQRENNPVFGNVIFPRVSRNLPDESFGEKGEKG